MKVRSFTLTLSLATIVLVAIFVAVPLIAEQECSTDEEYEKRCEDDDRITGYGIIEKEDNRVKAKAQCHANATKVDSDRGRNLYFAVSTFSEGRVPTV